MIIGTLLRNYKCYSGINYIPVSNGTKFNAFIGENGAGKSTVLEALDVFFNGGAWNVNNDAVANGLSTRTPHICVVLALEKRKWSRISRLRSGSSLLHYIVLMSEILWDADIEDFNSANRDQAKKFISHRDTLTISSATHYLCAIGQQYESAEKSFLSIFHSMQKMQSLLLLSDHDKLHEPEKQFAAIASSISKFITPNYNYIYTPAEVDVQRYTKIESKAIQKLSGKNIETILKDIISQKTLAEINKKLAEFIGDIENTLVDYEYKKPAQRQSKLNISDLSNKVIESYFSIRVLNRREKGTRIPVSHLSSGEKKKALVDISYAFLKRSNKLFGEIIFAMDEPEASLHTGAIFDQFERIYQISKLGVQCLVTTHWYGFVPILTTGTATNIYKDGSEISNSVIDIAFYRETIKQQATEHKGKLPTDISLKSRNDLVQTIIASIRKPSPYSWIICEGTSERIYFEHYFASEVIAQTLKVLPVGGAKEVKRLFEYLELPIKEDEKNVKGKVFCLIDTDAQSLECNFKDYPNLKFRRLLDLEDHTRLVKGGDSQKTPATDIEDSLEASYFQHTLELMQTDHPAVVQIFENMDVIDYEYSSASAFNWRKKDHEALKNLFKEDGFKVEFAKMYTNLLNMDLDESTMPPQWIIEIRQDFI